MARYGQVKGLPVVTMAEGKSIGNLDGLLIDPAQKAVRWLKVGGGGLFSGARWVPMQAVNAFGPNAVTVNGEADVLEGSQAQEVNTLMKAGRYVLDAPVVTTGGEKLGTVRDFDFAPDTGQLTALVIDGYSRDERSTLPGSAITTIGQDAIMVTLNQNDLPNEPAGTVQGS